MSVVNRSSAHFSLLDNETVADKVALVSFRITSCSQAYVIENIKQIAETEVLYWSQRDVSVCQRSRFSAPQSFLL